ncbi:MULTISPECIES: major capsid protein [unclassified Mesorhizobium]|uniref:major capsid protein n=1 Tax=unclassified Mesorhizobium TaxID=325217 RepID=UPI00112E5486|nr:MULTISPECIES: major capsid protein [unclassified Mesorhizobium]MCA0027342.1 major capsid protein [Mesorhizobium sp. B263B1A]TPJ98617.1 major capsid protein [Mesorhizobium sp. B2-5-12]TPK28779.1 major capsid protein [Mesorhizobium sp. B2-5-6]
MLSMDAFNDRAFSMVSLTAAINNIDYVPNLLGSLGIFEDTPVYTRTIAVEKKGQTLSLIPTSPLGAAPRETDRDGRDIRDLRTVRLADSFTLYAYEVEGIRAFGTESEFESLQVEYAGRMAKVRTNMELTHEYHRLGALQGKLLDADGTSVIYNYFTEFGIAEPAAIDFNLDDVNTDVWAKCQLVKRAVIRASKGVFTPASSVHALAGDAFYDALTQHPKVFQFYMNWQAAQQIREVKAFESFEFGGIVWHNYRGTDDNSTVAIPVDEAKFFPVNAPGVFVKAMAPAEFGPFVNTRGQDTYAINVLDKDRQAWTKGELYSYPLYLCARPDVLQKATRT